MEARLGAELDTVEVNIEFVEEEEPGALSISLLSFSYATPSNKQTLLFWFLMYQAGYNVVI